jgi:DNA-binding HxlR family transcriptional regulator
MGIGYAGKEVAPRTAGGGHPGGSIAEVLRLLGAGAPAAVLLALADGPQRTKVLTQRVGGYTPRTIYRHIPKLVDWGLIEREEGAGIRSSVVHSLTEGCGDELCGLIKRFAAASKTGMSGGQVEAHAWAPIAVMADLWEAGVIAELSRRPRSPTELAREVNGLSYHQLSRRAGTVNTAGFLREAEHGSGQRRCYALTEKARRTMGLIAGVGRWRDRHLATADQAGMTLGEMVTVLRASLPLVELSQHGGKRLSLYVVSGDDVEEVSAATDEDGKVEVGPPDDSEATAWAEGDIQAWCTAVLEGRFDGFKGGDERLVEDCFAALHAVLWTPAPF